MNTIDTYQVGKQYTCEKTNRKLRLKHKNISYINSDKISSISIEISILNRFCSHEYLSIMLNWVKQWNIPIEFSIGDVLHRYNIQTHYLHQNTPINSKKCNSLVKIMRTDWLETNLDIINKELHSMQFKLNVWENWLNNPLYLKVYKQLEEYVASSDTHTYALEKDIQRISQKPNWLSGTNIAEKKDLLIKYMFEEITVYYLQNINKSTLHIYPGGMSYLLKSLHKDKKCPVISENRKFINFNFRGEQQNAYQNLSEWIKNHE